MSCWNRVHEHVLDPLGALQVARPVQGRDMVELGSDRRSRRSAGDRPPSAQAVARLTSGTARRRARRSRASAGRRCPARPDSTSRPPECGSGSGGSTGRSWSGAPGTLPPSAGSRLPASGNWPSRCCAHGLQVRDERGECRSPKRRFAPAMNSIVAGPASKLAEQLSSAPCPGTTAPAAGPAAPARARPARSAATGSAARAGA
jgi:hypothetical protein